MKQLHEILESILSPDFDITGKEIGTILANLTKIKVYPFKELRDTTTLARLNEKQLIEIKKAIQPKLPISSSIDEYLPADFRAGKKYECLGQIIYWVLSQKEADDPSCLNDTSILKKFEKEVCTQHGFKNDAYIYVDWIWADYYVHYSQDIDGKNVDIILFEFSVD